MAGHFVIDVGRLNLAPFQSAGAVRSRPSISPPQNWVCPKGNARRSLSTGQVGVLLVCGKTTPVSWHAPRNRIDYLSVTRCRLSRLISLLATGWQLPGSGAARRRQS